MLASLAVLFTPASGVPDAPPGTDKVVHLVLFAALAASGRIARIPVLLPGLAAYAVVSEVLQVTLPLGRSFELADIGVDLAGALAGWSAVALARRRRPRSVVAPARRG
ncbi:hypothetical protein GCM10010470_56420 [Saccharopolyspora taberi]|uniref:VanZ-like domain-containing protein n=1 Tax=Saccharopolyspora taberi TaxID=60895 RepID=A0ABN3VMH4_9PSEU